MGFKSQAQRAKFAELVKNGKMKQSTFDEWHANSAVHLPERAEVQPSKLSVKPPAPFKSPAQVVKPIEAKQWNMVKSPNDIRVIRAKKFNF